MRLVIVTIVLLVSLQCSAQEMQLPRPPGDTASAAGITWALGNDSLYVSMDGGESWKAEASLGIPYPGSLRANKDSTVFLRDMFWDAYIYSLPLRKLTHYIPAQPLSSFLTAPVVSVRISYHYSACLSNMKSTVVYSLVPGRRVLHAKNYKIEGYGYSEHCSGDYKKIRAWNRDLDPAKLQALLQAINNDPESVPSISDFHITEEDKHSRPAYANRVDTISKQLLRNMFAPYGHGEPTQSFSLQIEMVNSKKESLIVEKYFNSDFHPWHLPFMVLGSGGRDSMFKCFSLDLSKLLLASLPKDFMPLNVYSNYELLRYMDGCFERQRE